MSPRQFAAAISAPAVIWTLLHLYIWERLFASTSPTPIASLGILLMLAAMPIAALAASRRERAPASDAIAWLGFTSLALSSLLVVFVAVSDLTFARHWMPPLDLTRVIVATTIGLTAIGVWRARYPSVVTTTVPIDGLHPDLEGYRIVQITDLHVSGTVKRPFVERVVRAANALSPDAIALTGDVADAFPAAAADDVAPLRALEARDGKFFVTGNHEYYWDAPRWVAHVRHLGFEPLVNAHATIARGGARVLIAGVTDGAGANTPGHRPDPAAAVAGAPDADVRVLLAHQPASIFGAKALGFDLQISGHTHGGQYFPFNLLIRFFQPFVSGLHRVEKTWLYVSRGTGYWGPPVRLGAPPEITLLILTRAVDERQAAHAAGQLAPAGC